jgi:hypothetical protein
VRGGGVGGGDESEHKSPRSLLRLPSDGCPADLRQRCHQLAALRRAAVTSATTSVTSAGMGPLVNEVVCCETWSASTSTVCMAAGGVRVTSSSQGLVLEIAATGSQAERFRRAASEGRSHHESAEYRQKETCHNSKTRNMRLSHGLEAQTTSSEPYVAKFWDVSSILARKFI